MLAIQAEVQVKDTQVKDTCLHTQLESLGSGGNATYRRCLGCDGVLVTFAGRMWLIPAPRGGRKGRERSERRGGAR